jgi:polysaccharide pyruvyl transferase WcaK-like protein
MRQKVKNKHPVITLLGSNSGRNVGDAAIMSAIVDVLSKEIPNSEFLVPSTKPSFINDNYGKQYNVKGVNIMPWTGSIRLLGIPTLWSLWRSDIALICDGIIFGKKLFNPLFNFLITLVFIVPLARLLKCKVVCYSCGIGPFPSKISKTFAKWVLNACDLVIMREHDSRKLAQEIGVTKPIHVTGDAAFLNKVSSDVRAKEILLENNISSDMPLFGVNVTKYFDAWLEPNERVTNREEFLKTLASGIKAASLREKFKPIVFSTQPMDEEVAWQLAKLLGTTVIANSKYLSHDMQAVMRRTELFMGMRFHSVVLASAVETPIIGLIYAPKVRGFMRLLDCENYALELAALNSDNLTNTIEIAWKQRKTIKAKQKIIVDKLKDGAYNAALQLKNRYFGNSALGNNAFGNNAGIPNEEPKLMVANYSH